MNQIDSKSIHLIQRKKKKQSGKEVMKNKLYYVYLLVFRDIITYKYLCEYFFRYKLNDTL